MHSDETSASRRQGLELCVCRPADRRILRRRARRISGSGALAGRLRRGHSRRPWRSRRGHVPTHPLSVARKQGALKDSVIQRQLKGDKSATGKVVKVGKGQYVELQREATDPVFVIIVEFGDAQHPNPIFQGPPPDGSATDVTGPLHNEIPQPDRSVDNSTLWKADYNREHYVDMYFNRMANYYKAQSSEPVLRDR
jgi:Immune inhibitor A peptidase M6.